jgi:YwiC-like protein
MTFVRPPIPKKHGAWAVLVVPMIVGAGVAGYVTVDHLLMAVSALLAFLSTVPVQTLLRHRFVTPQPATRVQQATIWGAVYLAGAFLALVPLLLDGLFLLPGLAAIGTVAFTGNFVLTRAQPKTVLSDLLAVAGLCLGAPASYYVALGFIDHNAIVLWLLHVLFFGCSVFYVQMKINALSSRKGQFPYRERIALGRRLLLYLTTVLAIVTLLVTQQLATPYALLAFVPMTVHALIGTFRLSATVRFKRLGFFFLGHSMMFGLILGFFR